jgi:hypothetical protein
MSHQHAPRKINRFPRVRPGTQLVSVGQLVFLNYVPPKVPRSPKAAKRWERKHNIHCWNGAFGKAPDDQQYLLK